MPKQRQAAKDAAERKQRRTEALARFIQDIMPWPFSDVERDSTEAEETATEMAWRLIDPIHAELEKMSAALEAESKRARE